MSSSYSMSDTDPRALFQLRRRPARRTKDQPSSSPARHSIAATSRSAGRCRQLFKGAYIVNEGLTKDRAQQAIERGDADAAAFGRLFIANPDLVERFRSGAALNALKSETIYMDDETGYNDYPLLGEAAE